MASVNLDVTSQLFFTSQALKFLDVFLEKDKNLFSQFGIVYSPKWLVEIENLLAKTGFLLVFGQLFTVSV